MRHTAAHRWIEIGLGQAQAIGQVFIINQSLYHDLWAEGPKKKKSLVHTFLAVIYSFSRTKN